jgi:hypothetical protein
LNDQSGKRFLKKKEKMAHFKIKKTNPIFFNNSAAVITSIRASRGQWFEWFGSGAGRFPLLEHCRHFQGVVFAAPHEGRPCLFTIEVSQGVFPASGRPALGVLHCADQPDCTERHGQRCAHVQELFAAIGIHEDQPVGLRIVPLSPEQYGEGHYEITTADFP